MSLVQIIRFNLGFFKRGIDFTVVQGIGYLIIKEKED